MRALEVVELTGQPFAASAPTIGEPRWDTRDRRIGLGDGTSRRAAALRTDTMFADGLVDEVVALLDRGLRDGVTASRALGYAQVLAALDDGGGDAAIAEARERDVHRHPALRAQAAVVVPPRPPHPWLDGRAGQRRHGVDAGGTASRIRAAGG